MDSIKENITKYRPAYLFTALVGTVAILLMVMFKFDLGGKVLSYASHATNRDEEQIVHDFTAGMKIEQEFSSYEDFDFITLSFSDHDVSLQGKLVVQVTEGDNILIYEERDVSHIHYSIPMEISFRDAGGGKADTAYRITLQSVEADETALGVFGYKTETNRALINGEESEYGRSMESTPIPIYFIG